MNNEVNMSQINQVRLIFNNLQNDLYYLHQKKRYMVLFLFGKEEDEYFVLDNPISETLSPWISIVINGNDLDIEIKSYGLNALDFQRLNTLRQETGLALKSKSNFDIDVCELFSPEKWHYKLE